MATVLRTAQEQAQRSAGERTARDFCAIPRRLEDAPRLCDALRLDRDIDIDRVADTERAVEVPGKRAAFERQSGNACIRKQPVQSQCLAGLPQSCTAPPTCRAFERFGNGDVGDTQRIDEEPDDPMPFGYTEDEIPIADCKCRVPHPNDRNGPHRAG